MDDLHRLQVRRLRVFLSGGASSSAWLRPATLSETELEEELERLYAKPLSIRELNSRRARLCLLKQGGAARLLRWISPSTHARVELISDVAPFGPEVVGSGPFWSERIPHRVLADNSTLRRAFCEFAKAHRLEVLSRPRLLQGQASEWVQEIAGDVARARHPGVLVYGGEPQLELPAARGRGGRLTHLAALLTLRFEDEIRAGVLEILCASSDGVDGASGSAASFVDQRILSALAPRSTLAVLRRAVARADTGSVLARAGALIPSFSTGTNVQDLVAIRLRRSSSSKSCRTKPC
jgi:hydroxypyruvate reductase